jgi:hypothetical protein
MICSQEIPVPGSMPRVVRVLLHVDSAGATHHVYLRGAQALRPDLHHGVKFQERVGPKQAARLAAPTRRPAAGSRPAERAKPEAARKAAGTKRPAGTKKGPRSGR